MRTQFAILLATAAAIHLENPTEVPLEFDDNGCPIMPDFPFEFDADCMPIMDNDNSMPVIEFDENGMPVLPDV